MTFLFPLLIGYLVLVMVSRAGPESCTLHPHVVILSVGDGDSLCQAIIQTADHAPQWVCYTPCTLNTFFCWFLKMWQRIVVAEKGFILCPHHTHHAFPVTVTNGCPGCRSLTYFSVYFIYCWTFSRPEYACNISTWALRNHQSINQSVLAITIKLYIQTQFIADSSSCTYKHRS